MINAKYVCIVFLSIYSSTTSALQCFSCQDVPDKRDCNRLVTCGTHETCYTNHVTDGVKSPTYNLGCVDQYSCSQHSQSGLGKREMNPTYPELANGSSDHERAVQTTCSQCCNSTDGCNLNICGQVPQTRRRCLSCRDVLKPSDCDKITDCSLDEFCYVHKGVNQNIATYESRYDFGCMGPRQCLALATAYTQSCVKCCNNTDLCNLDACNGWQPTTWHPPTTLMKTTAKTTIVSTHIVINGPTKVHNTVSTTLTCVTDPPAQSYSWKFNGTIALPNGAKIRPIPTNHGSVAGVNTLLITNVSASAVGIYTCVAYSNGQIVERTHSLRIFVEKPTVHITKSPITLSFALQCQTTGYPAPHIRWDFIPATVGSHGIPAGVMISDEASRSTLYVQHYQKSEHTGTWYCKASNSAGTAMTQVSVS